MTVTTKSRKVWLVVAATVLIGGMTTAALVFQPWRLFVDVVASESIPTTAPGASGVTVPDTDTSSSPSIAVESPGEERTGSFISHGHTTTGDVRILQLADGSRVLSIEQLADGSRVLSIEGLMTTDGPDVHVWLSATDVVEGEAGWSTAGTGDHLDLGILRANIGDLVYEIPADVDLAQFASVSLWCEQFAVSFGAAQLAEG